MKLTRKKVLEFIKGHGLFAPGDKIVIAFSGGADSMALVDILANLPGYPLQVVIAHLNHCLRGAESEGDELFVRSVAEKYAFPLAISRVDVAAAAAEQGLSLEEAGRNARRSFFLELAEKQSAVAVVLGHHRDDQAETVLMRLFRGAAGSGLQGMQPRTAGNIFRRPLLCLNRTEIESYLRKGSLQWREDSSNLDVKFLRNRIRHELLPLLKSYNPELAESINRTAQAFAADEELLDAVVEQACSRIVSTLPDAFRINLEMLRHELPALRKRLYRKVLFVLRGDLKRISSQHLADIDRLATGNKGRGQISLPSGVLVIRKYAAMILTTIPEEMAGEKWELMVDSCGSHQLEHKRTLLVERVDSSPADWLETGKDTIFIDLQRFPFPWTVRCCREGDRFTPFGMRGTKKIKDLFIDNKIPLESRKRVPLFLSGGEIFWIGGVQLSEKARISEVPGDLLRLRMIGVAPPDWH